jgi:hypothetical protein
VRGKVSSPVNRRAFSSADLGATGLADEEEYAFWLVSMKVCGVDIICFCGMMKKWISL